MVAGKNNGKGLYEKLLFELQYSYCIARSLVFQVGFFPKEYVRENQTISDDQ